MVQAMNREGCLSLPTRPQLPHHLPLDLLRALPVPLHLHRPKVVVIPRTHLVLERLLFRLQRLDLPGEHLQLVLLPVAKLRPRLLVRRRLRRRLLVSRRRGPLAQPVDLAARIPPLTFVAFRSGAKPRWRFKVPKPMELFRAFSVLLGRQARSGGTLLHRHRGEHGVRVHACAVHGGRPAGDALATRLASGRR
jgi:hypothetical protein